MYMEQRGSDQERLKQPPRLKLPEMTGQNPNNHPQQQPPPPQKCPRCDSSNTKFCYYNNYSLSQPRYFCKNCRRYWTHGGTLRNVPVGGGYRKSKRPKPSVPSPSRTPALPPAAADPSQPLRPSPPIMTNTFYNGGSFLSSLAAMHSFSAGINQSVAVNLGGASGQYDPNTTLLQGIDLQSIKPPLPPPQQYPWTQSIINRSPAADNTAASAAATSFWSGATSDRNNQVGSSFDPNHWQDSSNQGFDP